MPMDEKVWKGTTLEDKMARAAEAERRRILKDVLCKYIDRARIVVCAVEPEMKKRDISLTSNYFPTGEIKFTVLLTCFPDLKVSCRTTDPLVWDLLIEEEEKTDGEDQ